jgi:pimeloyl-ACP methyl ester carboxylesterase
MANTGKVITTDGRTVTYCVWGPSHGGPVFWLHGVPGSRFLRHPDETYERVGARVVTYDRAGYGGSDPLSGRRVIDTAADVVAIADAEGFDQFAVSGVSAGGPYALAVAARHGGRVTRCATVVGIAPFGVPDLDFHTGMSADRRASWLLAERGDEQALAERVMPSVAAMLDELRHGDLVEGETAWARQMFIQAIEAGLARGPRGVVDDYLALVRSWGFDVGDIACPTRIMVARDDEEIPASHGRWLVDHIPGAVLVEAPGGHYDTRDAEEAALMGWLATGTTRRDKGSRRDIGLDAVRAC